MVYYIYASNSGKSEAADVHVLAAGSSTDKFIASLPNKGIILESEPNDSANLDSSDRWAQWMSNLDPKGKFTLTWDSQTDKSVQSFQFGFATPFSSTKLTFSSSIGCINNAFGAPATTGGSPQAKIPVPGIGTDGDMLYCGLDTAGMDTLSSTVAGLFTFVGIADLTDYLPANLSSATTSFDPANAYQQRNALWIRPSFGFQTSIRLSFQLRIFTPLQELLAKALRGLTLLDVSVVCKKVLASGKIASGTSTVYTGSVVFYATGTIQSPSGSTVGLSASVEFGGNEISLIFLVTGDKSLDGILSWLGGLISSDLGTSVNDLLNKEGVLGSPHLRRIRLTLNAENPASPTLSSFGFDVEIPANFGHDDTNNQEVTFLLSYFYSKDTGSLGMLSGQFWPATDTPDETSPYYEPWTTLVPSNSNTATYINLATVIKGHSIGNIPDTIPSKITRAFITLSDESFEFGATVAALKPKATSVPLPYLGEVAIDASYTWGQSSAFKLTAQISAGLLPSAASKHQVTAALLGQLKYDSGASSWELKASLEGLYASALCHFIDSDSAGQVVPLIDSIEIDSLDVTYKYTKSNGSFCTIVGALFIAGLELDLSFSYQDTWSFVAKLKPSDDNATLRAIISNITGDDAIDIPDFAANMNLGKSDGLKIGVFKGKVAPFTVMDSTPAATPFLFSADIKLGSLELGFAQYRNSDWASSVPSKRAFKAALTALPAINVPLIGNVAQPFDEMYYLWVQDNSGKNSPGLPGLTRDEVKILQQQLSLVTKDGVKNPAGTDVLVLAGSHFVVIMIGSNGDPFCLLDYDFAKPQVDQNGDGNKLLTTSTTTTTPAGGTSSTDNGSSSQVPLKKVEGPITIRNLGLKYSEKTLHILLDASLVLGPLGFALDGFGLSFAFTTLDDPMSWSLAFTLEGLSVVFEKSPLTIAGTIRHGNDGNLNYYAGGLIVGFVPYQFVAAGFYGTTTDTAGNPFTSVFVFAKLNGPLVTLEFATISGITGGIGYNSQVRFPAAAEVVQFPFIAPKALEGSTDDALLALKKLISPDAGGWFSPQNDSYWAAAGMKIDAFQMFSIDAVVVVELAASIKLAIFAVATADIPTAKSPKKFAHVELGIAVTVDFAYGVLRAEGQLSPTSYILAPDCHLTGGFGFCYWFDAPHADVENVGQFVFTVGGYHPAFDVPASYPNPPRLGITWNLGSELSITGEAYFAITPKVCMGGGRLHAAFSAGPIEAWLDAFANFLINYEPFHFRAEAGVTVGVRFNLDLLFIHTHISAEIGATLTLWGPPVAGRVHVNLWVHAFDINFGDSDEKPGPLTLELFLQLLQQSAQQASPGNKAHVFIPLTGLMSSSDSAEKKPGAPWTVRGGTFSFTINCTVACDTATSNESTVNYTDHKIYAKPMYLQSPLSSSLTIQTLEGSVNQDIKWGLEQNIKSVPEGLWGYYDPQHNPSDGRNNNDSTLLDSGGTGIPLMMGVTLTAPPPILSPDKLPRFNIADADLLNLTAQKHFPEQTSPHQEFRPVKPLVDPESHEDTPQYDAVFDAWTCPGWESTMPGAAARFVQKWARTFGWDAAALSQLAALPAKLEAQFSGLYVAAPLLTA